VIVCSCLFQIKLMLLSDLQGKDEVLMMIFWHIYACMKQWIKCYDFAFHSSSLLLCSVLQWWELLIDSFLIISLLPSGLLSGRIIIFPHNSKYLSVIKRTKPFPSTSASKKCPGKYLSGLEFCICLSVIPAIQCLQNTPFCIFS